MISMQKEWKHDFVFSFQSYFSLFTDVKIVADFNEIK